MVVMFERNQHWLLTENKKTAARRQPEDKHQRCLLNHQDSQNLHKSRVSPNWNLKNQQSFCKNILKLKVNEAPRDVSGLNVVVWRVLAEGQFDAAALHHRIRSAGTTLICRYLVCSAEERIKTNRRELNHLQLTLLSLNTNYCYLKKPP